MRIVGCASKVLYRLEIRHRLKLNNIIPICREIARLVLMNGDKAPGSDDFTAAFWQTYWTVVRGDVMKMFADLYNTWKFVRILNSTFIVKIPKKGGAEDLRIFVL